MGASVFELHPVFAENSKNYGSSFLNDEENAGTIRMSNSRAHNSQFKMNQI